MCVPMTWPSGPTAQHITVAAERGAERPVLAASPPHALNKDTAARPAACCLLTCPSLLPHWFYIGPVTEDAGLALVVMRDGGSKLVKLSNTLRIPEDNKGVFKQYTLPPQLQQVPYSAGRIFASASSVEVDETCMVEEDSIQHYCCIINDDRDLHRATSKSSLINYALLY